MRVGSPCSQGSRTGAHAPNPLQVRSTSPVGGASGGGVAGALSAHPED